MAHPIFGKRGLIMNKFRHINLLCACCIAFFTACSDDTRIDNADVPKIEPHVFVIPENYSNDAYKHFLPKDTVEVDVNEKIKFVAAYSIDGSYQQSTSYAADNFQQKWTIGNENSHNLAYPYSFAKAGIQTVYLETIDLYADTTKDSVVVIVNTPSVITLKNPPNNYNIVDSENKDGLEMQWEITGIDTWETANCNIYISEDQDLVWEYPIGSVPCDHGALLSGSLVPSAGSADSSHIFYWGVSMKVTSITGKIETISSDISKFITTFISKDLSKLVIPIALKSLDDTREAMTEIKIISRDGNVLSTLYSSAPKRTLSKKIIGQSGIKVLVCETVRAEYGCDSVIVDAYPQTTTVTDTITLVDKIRPGVLPLQKGIGKKDSIRFSVLDNGSGINISTLAVKINQVQQKANIDGNTVSLKNSCKGNCELFFYIEDFAGNKSADLYWTLTVENDSTFIEGPFPRTEDL